MSRALERLAAVEAAVAELRAALEAGEAPDAPAATGVAATPPEPAPGAPLLAWGAKVSQTFRERVRWIAEDLEIGDGPLDGANKFMTCMAWESGRSFRADVKNMAGSGATGLIQFMPATAKGLGTTVEKLAAMTPEDQLNFVWKYFAPYKGRLKTLSDIYMAILWPAAVGKPESFVLWDRGERPTTYRQNAGLDVNADGRITKAEAAGKVAALLPEGLLPHNAGGWS